ncbi:MAG: Clp protease N-terminal domain-containing protein, partial [Roseobacter sp.]
MDLSKFTERSRGFIQAAQTIATRDSHQRLTPEHLLKALMDDEQGLASNLIAASGGQPAQVVQALELALGKMPKVTGDAAQVYLDNATAKVLAEAEALAKKAGDSFVPVERILMALCMVKSGAKAALEAGKVTAQGLNGAINEIRKGRTADTASAEEGYDALKKYAMDLTQRAEEGKIDPIIGRDEEIRRAMQVLSRRTKN